MEIRLNKIIARGRMLEIKGTSIWVPLKYEKLSKLCFKCGSIVHGSQGCIVDVKQGCQDDSEQFGAWLHADSSTSRKTTDRYRMGEQKGKTNSEQEMLNKRGRKFRDDSFRRYRGCV